MRKANSPKWRDRWKKIVRRVSQLLRDWAPYLAPLIYWMIGG